MSARVTLVLLTTLIMAGCAARNDLAAYEAEWEAIERSFTEVPMEARRLCAPLFWLHGDESAQRLEHFLEKVAEGHNGGFIAESRPHSDFLGPGWYRDLDICLAAARKHNLQMWIFDEKWWPSQSIGGKVPERYAAKKLLAESFPVGPDGIFQQKGFEANLVAVVAGRHTADGIDPDSLIDLTPAVRDGQLSWTAPPGNWHVMKFTWTLGPRTSQGLTVDGASQDCVDWYIQTVYQPHFDRYREEFGKTIVGFFYDEPEVHGDWGTEVFKVLRQRGIDWKKPLVAWKFQLAGEEQIAARYQYLDAVFEAWGRTLYGSLQRWCQQRGVKSIGHFIEHANCYLRWEGPAPGNMFQMQKYSDMGGIDNVFNQFRIGDRVGRDAPVFQTPKLGSSISHVYGKADDVAMCEVFGADGQDLAYSSMKWQADQHQVRGINFMVPHSFNPRAPFDTDCPPYFYMEQFEPRWPLYRIWADYTNRLSVLLTGGRHVCPIATIVCGNSVYAGRAIYPDQITDVLDDIQFDSDWVPYDALALAEIRRGELLLHRERYRVLIAPPAEVVPWEVLAKIKAFFDSGGIVIGYGIMPSRSATLGKNSREIASLCEAIWGKIDPAKPPPGPCRTSRSGGRSYFLKQQPSHEELRQVLTADAGLHPSLEVLQGRTDNWLHVLHRVKAGRDIFFICNQNASGDARRFRFRATAAGYPERWDAMRNEITAIPFQRVDRSTVDFELTMQPCESALIVFRPSPSTRPLPVDLCGPAGRQPVPVVRISMPPVELPVPRLPEGQLTLEGAPWVWFPEGQTDPVAPPGTRFFRRLLTIPQGRKIVKASAVLAADNRFTLFLNERKVGEGSSWQELTELDLKADLNPGVNVLAISASNAGNQPNPAGLIGRFRVEFEGNDPLELVIDSSWKASNVEETGWASASFDDSAWPAAQQVAAHGQAPWGAIGARVTLSPVRPDPFVGTCDVPNDVDLVRFRVCLEMDDLPDTAGAVLVNGRHAGGVIGRPLRLDISSHLKPGQNRIEILPQAPKAARVCFYPK